ncbi:hypothetical protein [Methanosarcina mazei]|nr:hypothetical protein [Methanosarcina mazei]
MGSSVNKNTETSDVLQVINFLGKFLKNEDNWVINNIKDIFEGNSGLEDPTGIDIFSPQYPEQKLKFLRESGLSPEEIYTNILKKVFHTVGSAKEKSHLNAELENTLE